MKLLLKPNDKKRQFQNLINVSAIEPPIWLAIMANLYEDCVILDAEAENLNFNETLSKIHKIGIDAGSEIIILPTGNHPSAQIQQREIAYNFLDALNDFTTVTVLDKLSFNPIELGSPDWERLDLKKYRSHNWHSYTNKSKRDYGVVYTSISCPMACKFCQVKDWYGSNYKVRSIDDVIKDFIALGEKGITNIKIMDELFITKNKRTLELCKAIKELGFNFNIWCYARLDTINFDWLKDFKDAGINWFGIGIESGNQEIRKKNNKGNLSNEEIINIIEKIKNNDICIGANYIFGFPEDDMNTMTETLDLAKKLNCEFSNFYCMMAYPGSELYDYAKSKNWYVPENPIEYSQYSFECYPLRTEKLTSAEVLLFRDNAYKIYYSNKNYQDYMKKKFGEKVFNDINETLKINLRRKLYDCK